MQASSESDSSISSSANKANGNLFDHDFDGATWVRGARARGTRQDVAWNAFCLTAPMFLLTITLLALISKFRVDTSNATFPTLNSNTTDRVSNDAYYVNLNSTFLIFLVSWMSSLAPMTTGLAVTLAAYPIAGQLLKDTAMQHADQLLTPFQLALTLKLLNGSSWSAVWNMIQYRFGWGHRSNKQGRALKSLFRVTLMVLFFSGLVFSADTWLHITTSTVSITQLSKVLNRNVPYSISLIPDCTATNNTADALYQNGLNCTIVPHQDTIINTTSAIETLTDVSETLRILANSPSPADAFMSLPLSKQDAQKDYTATTIGLHTQCKPITQECHINNPNSATLAYNCSRANGNFADDTDSQSWERIRQVYFSSPEMSNALEYAHNNTIYYGIAAATTQSLDMSTGMSDDPEIIAPSGTSTVFTILFCEAAFYDVTYSRVQGSITSYVKTASNASLANAFLIGMYRAGFGTSNLENAITEATGMASSAQDLADQFATAFGKTVLSVGAASVMQTPVLAAQERSAILVARVPKAPLYLLVVTNLCFILMGVVLSVIAAMTSREAHEVQGRLSIEGLVANMFEGERANRPSEAIERLFGEYWDTYGGRRERVGIDRTSVGGYAFKALAEPVMSRNE